MTELETTARYWKASYEGATLKTHPSLWVAFFGRSYRGALWINEPANYSEAALWMAAPFAFCPEILTCFIVVDRDQTLRVTRLMAEGSGVRQSNWRVHYHVSDRGKVRFGMSSWEHDAFMPVVVEALMNRRLGDYGTVDFDTAYHLASQWGKHETV